MKTGAIIALIIAVMGMLLNFGNYLFHLVGRPSLIITRITWPVQIIMGSLPVIILCIAVMTHRNHDQ